MRTLSYVLAEEEEIGDGGLYYLGQLTDGEGDLNEILESGCIGFGESVIDFKVMGHVEEDPLETLVQVTGIR